MPDSQPNQEKPAFIVTVLLYDQFDLLEVSGPLEMFAALPSHFDIQFISQSGRPVTSAQGAKLVSDFSLYHSHQSDILLVPGGIGVQQAAVNTLLIDWLQQQGNNANYICSVGTGAALLAQAGVLKDKAATTSKKHYRWVTGIGHDIRWCPVARWVKDGNVFTSSGASAGLDLSLAMIAQLLDEETARKTAIEAEYIWINDPSDDPFAPLHIVH